MMACPHCDHCQEAELYATLDTSSRLAALTRKARRAYAQGSNYLSPSELHARVDAALADEAAYWASLSEKT